MNLCMKYYHKANKEYCQRNTNFTETKRAWPQLCKPVFFSESLLIYLGQAQEALLTDLYLWILLNQHQLLFPFLSMFRCKEHQHTGYYPTRPLQKDLHHALKPLANELSTNLNNPAANPLKFLTKLVEHFFPHDQYSITLMLQRALPVWNPESKKCIILFAKWHKLNKQTIT